MIAIAYRMSDGTRYLRKENGNWVHSINFGEVKKYPSKDDPQFRNDLCKTRDAMGDNADRVEAYEV